MALLSVDIPSRQTWSEDDTLRLLLGDEGALNLSASDPSGGELVATASPLENAQHGGLDVGALDLHPLDRGPLLYGLDHQLDGRLDHGSLPATRIEHAFDPDDICAVVPFGVAIADQAGNVSDVFESFTQVSDRPRGARGVTLAPTDPAETGKALLSWDLSDDIED